MKTTLQDLVNLITLRNFLTNSVDNLNVKMDRKSVYELINKIPKIDKKIVESSLELDLENLHPVPQLETITRSFTSSDDVLRGIDLKGLKDQSDTAMKSAQDNYDNSENKAVIPLEELVSSAPKKSLSDKEKLKRLKNV